ncbi:GNAT family N-acetyltransferase [Mycolicibacterium obuense]|uniref:Putative acetyltransferase n=1 Tax=Mycolicibacterium obuense TaxID=1807 RepID=A0A0J6Y526_9MYCO|nr:GNAT family N-acetyltransferase [Mycolicibacterium obuense]KMO68186.1 putative acetyltransferase [Mycolicibacterium obuense]
MSAAVRAAQPADVPAIERIVAAAYSPYIDRIGRAPAPMETNHYDLVSTADQVYVLTDEDPDGLIVGVLVLVDEPDHVFVDSVAVATERRGRGHGRTLLAFAEQRAHERGCGEVRLYTNAAMTENLVFYPRLGYVEVDRRVDNGYDRVYFTKDVG